MKRRSAALAVLTAAALAGVPLAAAAQEAERWVQTAQTMPVRLVEIGTWQFAATRLGPDGKPECYESWTFNADGTGQIVSGRQRVTTRWRTEDRVNVGHFVLISNTATTAGPDCLGGAIDQDEYPNDSPPFQLIFFDNGMRAMVCSAGRPVEEADGSTTMLLDRSACWGEIVPATSG